MDKKFTLRHCYRRCSLNFQFINDDGEIRHKEEMKSNHISLSFIPFSEIVESSDEVP